MFYQTSYNVLSFVVVKEKEFEEKEFEEKEFEEKVFSFKMVDFVHIYISPAKSKKSRKIKKSTPPLAFNGLLCIGEQNIIHLFCEILYSHFYPCSSLELYITFLFLYKSQTSNNKHQIQLENRKPNTENKDNKTETSRN